MIKAGGTFIKTAAVATIAATACGSLACSCSSKKATVTEKIKLLSPDGEIVEIDSAYLNHHENIWLFYPSMNKEWECQEENL